MSITEPVTADEKGRKQTSSPTASRKTQNWEIKALAAAKLRSEGKLQKEIAEILNTTQPEVSRLLKYAEEDRKWLQPANPILVSPPADLMEKMEQEYFTSQNLFDRLRALEQGPTPILRNVSVFYCRDRSFEPAVAEYMEKKLAQTRIMGVTWGRTVNEAISVLRQHLLRPPRQMRPIQFVPLCGEPLRNREYPIKFSSTALASALHEIINGDPGFSDPSLVGMPAFIPREFNNAQAQTILQFIRKVAGYTAVFGDSEDHDARPPLVDQVDTILTSIGVSDRELRGIFLAERVEQGDLTDEEMVRCAVGDMGGIMIPRPGLTSAGNRLIEILNERWTGIKLRHIKECATRAAHHPEQPGVIVLAIEPRRVDVVKRCVELGLVNELIIDHSLARALDRSLT